jgi:hypothetical protein
MLSEDIRELRRILRYRNHIVRTAVKMQNKMSGLLMEVGASCSKQGGQIFTIDKERNRRVRSTLLIF